MVNAGVCVFVQSPELIGAGTISVHLCNYLYDVLCTNSWDITFLNLSRSVPAR